MSCSHINSNVNAFKILQKSSPTIVNTELEKNITGNQVNIIIQQAIFLAQNELLVIIALYGWCAVPFFLVHHPTLIILWNYIWRWIWGRGKCLGVVERHLSCCTKRRKKDATEVEKNSAMNGLKSWWEMEQSQISGVLLFFHSPTHLSLGCLEKGFSK